VAVKGWQRAQDPALLVLTSLAAGPKHGYALIGDIEEIAGVALGPGTLYGVLARLEDAGLVEALPSEDRRRPYKITGAGSAALRERLLANSAIASIGLRRLGVTPT
jgi:DNA-binding PadR family transcriptional regulator